MSEMSNEEKVESLNNLFNQGLVYLNENINTKPIISEYCGGEQRTLSFVIKGITDKGFGLTEDGIVPVDELENPTVTISIDEDAFISFVVGDISFDDVLYVNDTKISGDYALRDIAIFRMLFDTFRELWEKWSEKVK